jgi:thiamine pyrophosphokinase
MSACALIFAGGDPLPRALDLDAEVGPVDLVIAADSGYDHALTLGRRPDVLVGDLDSISPAGLAAARRARCVVEQHPPDKDASDLELALDAALHRGMRRVVVVGGHGGRLDHLLGNALVLASSRFRALEVDGLLGVDRLHVVHDRRRIEAPPDTTCTLLAVHGPAIDVRTEGLAWPLAGETLAAGSSRGVSNRTVGGHFEVAVGEGTVLVVRPAAGGHLVAGGSSG